MQSEEIQDNVDEVGDNKAKSVESCKRKEACSNEMLQNKVNA